MVGDESGKPVEPLDEESEEILLQLQADLVEGSSSEKPGRLIARRRPRSAPVSHPERSDAVPSPEALTVADAILAGKPDPLPQPAQSGPVNAEPQASSLDPGSGDQSPAHSDPKPVAAANITLPPEGPRPLAFRLLHDGSTVSLDQSIVVGRGDDCDLHVPGSSISRTQLRFVLGAGTVAIEDLDSRNGTYLERTGKVYRVSSLTPVEEGDTILAGDEIQIGIIVGVQAFPPPGVR